MRSSFGSIAVLALAALSASAQGSTVAAPAIPHLQKQGTATQLVVDGKPFLMLAGELRNSSGSSLEYLKPIWPKLAAMHLNTVLTGSLLGTVGAERGPVRFHAGGRRDPGSPKK